LQDFDFNIDARLLAVAVNDMVGEFFRYFLEMVIFPVEGSNAKNERSLLQIMYSVKHILHRIEILSSKIPKQIYIEPRQEH
jgi:hypothetical protein